MESTREQEVNVHPDWACPVVVAEFVKWIVNAQTPDSKRSPESGVV